MHGSTRENRWKDDFGPAYEELKEALGPEASRKVAMVLDALTQEHVRTEVREAIDPLQAAPRQLVKAQVHTEQQLAELAEAQRRTEERFEALAQRVGRLAEAQRRTEEAVQALWRRLDETNRQLGGLTMTVGSTLATAADRGLPPPVEQE